MLSINCSKELHGATDSKTLDGAIVRKGNETMTSYRQQVLQHIAAIGAEFAEELGGQIIITKSDDSLIRSCQRRDIIAWNAACHVLSNHLGRMI